MNKIKVLVVDDSLFFREILTEGISSDPTIEVVATANDGFDAINKAMKFSPDVIICDIEMPKMNGVEFIQKILPQYPAPIVVVSNISEAVLESMNAGAVDFVTKPNLQSDIGIKAFINNLIVKTKVASIANISNKINKTNNYHHHENIINHENTLNYENRSISLIAIGASTGGTEAIYNILSHLPRTIPGIVIVQHIPPVFSRMFAERLNKSTEFDVKEAQTGDYVEKGKILIAPGDKHMQVKKIGDKYKIQCFEGDKVNGHCPSVDVLFESVAKECGSNAMGIILTGMGHDGSKGLLAMRDKGAITIGQDEKTSVVYGMPRVAYNIGAVEIQLPLEKIPETMRSVLK